MNPYESPRSADEAEDHCRKASESRILAMVSAQRGMMWLFVLKLGFDFTASMAAEQFDPVARAIYFVVFLGVTVSIAYFVFRLTAALYGAGPAIVCVLLSVMPCIGTFTVLVINGNAMDQLRKLGVKVGFMGASAMQLEQLRAADQESAKAPGQAL